MTQQNPTEQISTRLSFFIGNKLGLAILAVLIVIAGGVSYLVFKQIQAQNKEKNARTLLDMKGLVHSRAMIFLSNTQAGPLCDKGKADLAQAQQQLQQFVKAHPDAEADLEAYLIKSGLINNQDYLISYGVAYDPELARQMIARNRFLSEFVPSNAQIQYCQ